MIKHYLGAAFLALSLSACGETTNPINSKEEFIATATKIVAGSPAAGVAVAVVRSNSSNWAHGFGYANLETQQPMTENTVISIASISKIVTGTAIMRAVEQGLIDLDGDINDYLPFKVENPKMPGHIISPRHILTHTTGVLDDYDIYGSDAVLHFGGDNPVSLNDFLRSYLLPDGKLYSNDKNFAATKPGTTHSYSNVMYALAAFMLENVTGQPFDTYTRNTILKPLGMTASGWRYNDIPEQLLGKQYGNASDSGYEQDIGNTMEGPSLNGQRAYKRYGLATYADGGLKTSVAQLSNLLSAIMNNGTYNGTRILKEETLKEMLTPQTFGHGNLENMDDLVAQGLTFRFEDAAGLGGGSTIIGHSGFDPGTATFMHYDPTKDFGVIMITNTEDGYDVGMNLVELMFKNSDIF